MEQNRDKRLPAVGDYVKLLGTKIIGEFEVVKYEETA